MSFWLLVDKPPLDLAASHRSARPPTRSKASATAHVWKDPALLVPVSQEMSEVVSQVVSQIAETAMLDNSKFGL